MTKKPSQFDYDKLVYKGAILEVHSVGLRMPDGKVIPRDFIHYSGAVVILPILPNRSVVMIRNYRFAVGEDLLELPAGMLEANELPVPGALRELTEETGYTAGCIEPLGSFFSTPGSTDENMFTFVATDLRPGRQELESYEQIHVEIMPMEEVRRKVQDGSIHDAKTIATLAMYWLRTGNM